MISANLVLQLSSGHFGGDDSDFWWLGHLEGYRCLLPEQLLPGDVLLCEPIIGNILKCEKTFVNKQVQNQPLSLFCHFSEVSALCSFRPSDKSPQAIATLSWWWINSIQMDRRSLSKWKTRAQWGLDLGLSQSYPGEGRDVCTSLSGTLYKSVVITAHSINEKYLPHPSYKISPLQCKF